MRTDPVTTSAGLEKFILEQVPVLRRLASDSRSHGDADYADQIDALADKMEVSGTKP